MSVSAARASAPPELEDLARLVDGAGTDVDARVVCEVALDGERLPVWAIALGNPDPSVPAVGYFGGVHGLERIGEIGRAHV